MSRHWANRLNASSNCGAHVLGFQDGDARVEVVLVLHPHEEPQGRRVPGL